MSQLGGPGVSLSQGEKPDTEISREDQMKINNFSKLNMKYHSLKEDIKKLKKDLENLEDAGNQIEESMGDPLKLFVGECFIDVDEDAATQYKEKMEEEKTEELDQLNDEADEIEGELKTLKTFLYARFG